MSSQCACPFQSLVDRTMDSCKNPDEAGSGHLLFRKHPLRFIGEDLSLPPDDHPTNAVTGCPHDGAGDVLSLVDRNPATGSSAELHHNDLGLSTFFINFGRDRVCISSRRLIQISFHRPSIIGEEVVIAFPSFDVLCWPYPPFNTFDSSQAALFCFIVQLSPNSLFVDRGTWILVSVPS